ncbi:hypothetical protein CHUAL_001019 [Chamberlinius hualienensis]
MKLLMTITLLAIATIGSSNILRERRSIFGDVDPTKVPAMLNNPAFVEAQGRCILASAADANTLCDRIGKKLREHLGPSIQKADCPVACTQQERETIVEIIEVISAKYPELWQKISDFYKVTPEQKANLEKWAAANKAAKG